MKLYGAIASPYVTRVLMFARLKGIDLEMPDMPGSPRSDEYRAITPIGKIPSLVVDGKTIPETGFIRTCAIWRDAFQKGPVFEWNSSAIESDFLRRAADFLQFGGKRIRAHQNPGRTLKNFFQRIKELRAIATRYEKLATRFLALVTLASITVWLA